MSFNTLIGTDHALQLIADFLSVSSCWYMAELHQARAARTDCALPAHATALVMHAAQLHPVEVMHHALLSLHITMACAAISAAISLI